MKEFLLRLIKKFLHKRGLTLVTSNSLNTALMPVEVSDSERMLITNCAPYSTTGNIRMWSLLQGMRHVFNNKIEGDFVECGVYKGGNLALMNLFAKNFNSEKMIFGYDTFDGMSEPILHDVDLNGVLASKAMEIEKKDENIRNIHAFASLEQVKKNLQLLDAYEGVVLIKGKVEDTLKIPRNLPSKIAVLRLDTDWYESTKAELEILYPRLSTGGILIIDDYGHFKGAQKAVDEYFKNQSIWLHYVDYTCRLLIKS